MGEIKDRTSKARRSFVFFFHFNNQWDWFVSVSNPTGSEDFGMAGNKRRQEKTMTMTMMRDKLNMWGKQFPDLPNG